MIEETYLFLEFYWVIHKGVSFRDVLFGNPLNIIKMILPESQYLGGIVEIHAVGSIVQEVAYAIL